MQVHPRTLRLPSRTGAPSHSGLSTGGPNGLQFRFSQGGCQTHQGPSEGGTAKLRRLRAMPVAHAPQCTVFKLFRLAGGRGSFATVKSFSVACIVAVAVGAASPVAVRAQGDAAAPAPAVDPSWLQVDTVTKTATFQLVAGLTGLNGALNFNGFRDGELTLTVPLGWAVVMHFRNHDGMLPHSAEIIPDTHPLPTGPVAPAFPRAFTLRLDQGLISEQTDDIRFIADKGGSYLIFCGVPGHGAAGMWVRFEVSGSVRKPSLAATPAGKP
ncbi:MAG: hypothetical protein DMD57_00990 [Gemmatimonadetes bacterium]|nr:MAG: hypothetical protein DMD57_00990 [Gemmatimonadota bacterium]